jgi:hypothetical protein
VHFLVDVVSLSIPEENTATIFTSEVNQIVERPFYTEDGGRTNGSYRIGSQSASASWEWGMGTRW